MIRAVAAVVYPVLLSASALAAKPQIQWDPEYDFSTVGTFAWREPPEASLADSDPFLHSRIINAINYELAEYGLTEVGSGPDVYIAYDSSTETDVRITSTSVGYSFGSYGMGGWGYYGYGFGGPIATTSCATEVERGSLMVDVVDAIEKMAKRYRKLRAREATSRR